MLVEVARDEQRRRIEREPARGQVVRDDRLDDLGAVAPEVHEVESLTGEGGDPIVARSFEFTLMTGLYVRAG